MRATVAILGSIVVLFVGFYGLSEASSQTEEAAVNQGTNATGSAHNTADAVFEGLGQAFAPAMVWMGVAAIVLIALGYLVVASNNGR